MGVEGGGAGRLMFFIGKISESRNCSLRQSVMSTSNTWGIAPHPTYFTSAAFSFGRRWAFLGIELPQRFDRREILLKL
jgi:hypothetical protein